MRSLAFDYTMLKYVYRTFRISLILHTAVHVKRSSTRLEYHCKVVTNGKRGRGYHRRIASRKLCIPDVELKWTVLIKVLELFSYSQVPVERRTLPTDLPGPSRRRAMTTRRQSPLTDGAMDCGTGGSATGSVAPGGSTLGTTVLGVGCPGSGMQTSCSLPETPVFARGSDVPRTPQHAGNPTQPRRQPGWYAPTTATTGWETNLFGYLWLNFRDFEKFKSILNHWFSYLNSLVAKFLLC